MTMTLGPEIQTPYFNKKPDGGFFHKDMTGIGQSKEDNVLVTELQCEDDSSCDDKANDSG